MTSHPHPAGSTSMCDPPPGSEPPWTRQDLRVPREDGSLLARPSLGKARELARENHAAFEGAGIDLQGRTLPQLRQWARRSVVREACRYTSRLVGREVPEPGAELLIAAGHQPTLYHPGVWVKNFAAGELAQETGGAALNLVVDNDTFSTTRIGVPAGTRRHPTVEAVPFDDDRPTQPWEDARIANAGLFRSFGERVVERMARWDIEPLIGQMWDDAVGQMGEERRLAECLTAARHRQERRWGLGNLELPISRLCTLDPFLWFAGHLLAHLPRFREVHNRVREQYRRVNRVRSRTHPVPELQERAGGWLEAPFWIWREDEHRRGRVFARQQGGEILLSDGAGTFARLPLVPEGDACCAVEVLRALPEQGIRLRTRALTTTLFARLCLSDLFVHGIGGAKYDEMTDRIIARFFGLPAPAFLTLSATLHLPLDEPFDVEPADLRRLRGLLRDLDYNSDRHLTPGRNREADALLAEKKRLIDEQKSADNEELSGPARRQRSRENHRRWRRLREVNARLAEFTLDDRRRAEKELEAVEQQLRANAVLQSREFSFCLYPPGKLRDFMTGLRAD